MLALRYHRTLKQVQGVQVTTQNTLLAQVVLNVGECNCTRDQHAPTYAKNHSEDSSSISLLLQPHQKL